MEERLKRTAIHSIQGQPECYLSAWGLRGPQVRSAGGFAFPAVRANVQGRARGESEPERGSLKQLRRENGGSKAVIHGKIRTAIKISCC